MILHLFAPQARGLAGGVGRNDGGCGARMGGKDGGAMIVFKCVR